MQPSERWTQGAAENPKFGSPGLLLTEISGDIVGQMLGLVMAQVLVPHL